MTPSLLAHQVIFPIFSALQGLSPMPQDSSLPFKELSDLTGDFPTYRELLYTLETPLWTLDSPLKHHRSPNTVFTPTLGLA